MAEYNIGRIDKPQLPIMQNDHQRADGRPVPFTNIIFLLLNLLNIAYLYRDTKTNFKRSLMNIFLNNLTTNNLH